MAGPTFPRGSDYTLAMQNPATRLRDPLLKQAKVDCDSFRIPYIWSGGSVVMFRVVMPDGAYKAVRCFTTAAVAEMADRYAQLIPALRAVPPGLFVGIDFQREGIQVNTVWYPVLVMEWIEGQPLNLWIGAHRTAAELRPLIAQFDAIVTQLERLRMAHGDLQHGNILVDEHGQLRLIDYDGMYVPQLAGQATMNQGHRNYQLPARGREFDATIDRFSTIVIGLALRALAADPALWEEFGQSGENLLLTREDFLAPAASPLLHRLERLPGFARYIRNFRVVCRGRMAAMPTLATFLATTDDLQIPPAVEAPLPWVPTYPVRAAGDWNRLLLPFVGQYIELIGLVEKVEDRTTSDGKETPFMRIRFVRRNRVVAADPATFTVLIFVEGLQAFARAHRDPHDLVGQWIAVQQFLDSYPLAQGERPQMRIMSPASIIQVTAEEAQRRLHPLPARAPAQAAARRKRPPTSSGVAPAPPVPIVAPAPASVSTPTTSPIKTANDRERARTNADLWGSRGTPPVLPTPTAPPVVRPAPPAPPTAPRAPVSSPARPAVPRPLGLWRRVVEIVQDVLDELQH